MKRITSKIITPVDIIVHQASHQSLEIVGRVDVEHHFNSDQSNIPLELLTAGLDCGLSDCIDVTTESRRTCEN